MLRASAEPCKPFKPACARAASALFFVFTTRHTSFIFTAPCGYFFRSSPSFELRSAVEVLCRYADLLRQASQHLILCFPAAPSYLLLLASQNLRLIAKCSKCALRHLECLVAGRFLVDAHFCVFICSYLLDQLARSFFMGFSLVMLSMLSRFFVIKRHWLAQLCASLQALLGTGMAELMPPQGLTWVLQWCAPPCCCV